MQLRGLILSILLSIVLMTMSGCARFVHEFLNATSHGHYNDTPPERIYSGTREVSGSFRYPPTWVDFLFVLDLPLEIVADTVMLPYDVFLLVFHENSKEIDGDEEMKKFFVEKGDSSTNSSIAIEQNEKEEK